MNGNLFSYLGLIFFVTWSFALAKLSLMAFGRDLLPSRLRSVRERHTPDADSSARR